MHVAYNSEMMVAKQFKKIREMNEGALHMCTCEQGALETCRCALVFQQQLGTQETSGSISRI